MRKSTYLLSTAVTSAFILAGAGAALAAEVHWSYDPHEPDGPQNWGALTDSHGDIAFPACNGSEQSPIDIDEVSDGDEISISFDLDDTALTVKNNGHTIQVDSPGSTTTIDGVVWPLAQFHWHTDSEHTFEGELLPAEAHMVHVGIDGDGNPTFAVVGILFEYGKPNPVLQAMLNVLESESKVDGHYTVGTFTTGAGTVNAGDLLPKEHGVYTLAGSFTTPPCTEGVNWNVMMETMTVSRRQVRRFREILEDVGHFPTNNRPVQPQNDRTVTERESESKGGKPSR